MINGDDDGFVEWRVNGVHSNNAILRFRGVCKTDKIAHHKLKVDLNFLLYCTVDFGTCGRNEGRYVELHSTTNRVRVV